MTPPEAQGNRQTAEAPEAPPAASVCADSSKKMLILKTRPEFLKAASARRQAAPAFLLQARDRKDGDPKVQVGFTASKKTGNSVVRSRAKRRLREAARAVLVPKGQPGWDYVLVARPGATVTRLFTDLLADLETALQQVHLPRTPRQAPEGQK